MKYSAWRHEQIRKEFAIILQITRDRCVYTWTIQDFVDIWSEIGTFPISNSEAWQMISEVKRFGLITGELVGHRWELR